MRTSILILLGLLIAGVTGAGFLGWRLARNFRCRDCTLGMVQIAADADRNETTSEEEWRAGYEEMGLSYDAANPQRLSIGQMVGYLDRHWDETRK